MCGRHRVSGMVHCEHGAQLQRCVGTEPKALPYFLANEPVRLTPEDVKLLSYHLSRLIRSSGKRTN